MNQSKIPPPSDGSKCTSRYQTSRLRNSSVLMLVLVLITKRTYGDISETKRSAGVKATRCLMPFQIYRYTDIQVPLRCHSRSLRGQRTKSGNQKSGPVRLLVMNNQLDVLCKPEMYFHPSANRDRKQTLEKPFAGNIAVCGRAWHANQRKY